MSGDGKQRNVRLELFGVVVGLAACNLAVLPINAALALARSEPSSLDAMTSGALGGLFVGAVVAVGWRMANLTTSDLGINAMNYIIPALSIGWLFAFSRVEDVHVALLLGGIGVIIAANAGVCLADTREKSIIAEVEAGREKKVWIDS